MQVVLLGLLVAADVILAYLAWEERDKKTPNMQIKHTSLGNTSEPHGDSGYTWVTGYLHAANAGWRPSDLEVYIRFDDTDVEADRRRKMDLFVGPPEMRMPDSERERERADTNLDAGQSKKFYYRGLVPEEYDLGNATWVLEAVPIMDGSTDEEVLNPGEGVWSREEHRTGHQGGRVSD